jgi:hypothetical protein
MHINLCKRRTVLLLQVLRRYFPNIRPWILISYHHTAKSLSRWQAALIFKQLLDASEFISTLVCIAMRRPLRLSRSVNPCNLLNLILQRVQPRIGVHVGRRVLFRAVPTVADHLPDFLVVLDRVVSLEQRIRESSRRNPLVGAWSKMNCVPISILVRVNPVGRDCIFERRPVLLGLDWFAWIFLLDHLLVGLAVVHSLEFVRARVRCAFFKDVLCEQVI